MATKPILAISAKIDPKSTKKQIQSQLDKLSGSLQLTLGVDKNASKTIKETVSESKKITAIEKENLKLAREKNAVLKSDEKYYNYIIKTQMSIDKMLDRRLTKEKQTTAELDKQRQKLELFQAEMDRKSQKLTTGKFKGTVDQGSLSSLQDRVSGLSIGSTSDIKSVQAEMNKINSEFKNIALNAQQARTGFTRFGDEAKNSLIKFSEFFLIGGVVVGFLGQIQQAISTVYELSNALNEIRIVTNKSVEEVNKLGKSYNALAKELSTTTTEITKASAELFRQGLNDEQVNERLQATVKYAKISGLSIEESSKIITANANATGKSVNSIIDIMAKLGDETATGADEIGLAMSKVAGSAKVAGIPFEQLAAQIATVSSKTRESASTIGNSFKSILARYGSIKETGFNSDDAFSLNDITKALKSIGVQAVDTQGQLRPFGEVINEVGAKFNGLNRNTQAYVATAIGGSFQSNRLLTLLTSYPEALTNVEKAYNATGSAQAKFDIYLESNEAKLNKFKATMEELFINTINSGTIGNLLDFATGFVQFANNVDLLKIAMTGLIAYGFQALIPAIMASIAPMGALAGETVIATGAFTKLNAVILANPYVILAVAITGAIVLLNKQKSATEQLIEASNKNIESLEKESESSIELSESVEKLSEKQNRTYEESVKLKDAKAELIKIYPELKNIIESETTKQGELEGAIRKVTSARAEDSKEALKQQRYNLALNRNRYALMVQDLQNRLKTTVDVGTQTTLAGEINANQNVLNSINQQIKQLDDQKKLIDSFKEKVISPKKPDVYISGEESGIKTIKDKKTPSTPAEESYAVVEKDRYLKLNQAVKELNISLEQNKALQENTTKLENLNKLREDEIALYKKKQLAIANLAVEQRKERDELIKSLNAKGGIFQGKGDDASFSNYQSMRDKLIDKMNKERLAKDKTNFNKTKEQLDQLDKQFTRFAELQTDNIPQARLEWTKLQTSINSVGQEITNSLADAFDKEQEASKKRFEDIQKINEKIQKDTEDAYKDLANALEKQDEERLRQLKLSKEKEIAVIEAELDALEKMYKEQEDKIEKDDLNKKILSLEKEKNMRKLEGSLDANARIYEIDKELVELKKEQSAQERKDAFEKDKAKLESSKQAKQDELKKEEDALEERKRKQTYFEQAKQMIIKNSYDEIVNIMKTFDEQFAISGATQGQAWYDAFASKILQAQALLAPISSKTTSSGNMTSSEYTGAKNYSYQDEQERIGRGENVQTAFANGGLMEYTGQAIIHGSKTLPELALNSQQIANTASMLGINGTPRMMAQGLYNVAKSGNVPTTSGGNITIHQSIQATINSDLDVANVSKALAVNTARELSKRGVRYD